MRRNSRRATRTGQKDVGNMSTTATEDLFWELGNYKKTVKRVDDGAILCDDIYRMISERAEIEAKYAKKLTAWEEKWKKQTENGPLYATMKNAMLGILSEAGGRAKIHMDCYGRLQNQVLESIKQWKNESYHKNFMGNWKETKEVDEEFARAQKPWAEAFGKVQRAKKNYHAACKACQSASQALKNAEQDANMTKEKREKLQNNEDKHENIVAKMRKKYEEKLQRIGPVNTSYEGEMTKVFDKCQRMEEKKLQFVQNMLVEFHKSINIADDPRFDGTLKDMLESAYNGNVKHDLTWWSENYGADMARNWPRFEVYHFGGQDVSFYRKLLHKKRRPSVASEQMDAVVDELKLMSEHGLSTVRKTRKPLSLEDVDSSMGNREDEDKYCSFSAYDRFYRMQLECGEGRTVQPSSEKHLPVKGHDGHLEQDEISYLRGKDGTDVNDESSLQVADMQEGIGAWEIGIARIVCNDDDDDSQLVTHKQNHLQVPCDKQKNILHSSFKSLGPTEVAMDRAASMQLSVEEECMLPNRSIISVGMRDDIKADCGSDLFYLVSSRLVESSRSQAAPVEACSKMEPGDSVEASAPVFNEVDQSENDPMSTYQVPRSQQPSSIMNSPPYNGVSNPFESAGSRSDDEWDDPPPVSDAVGVPVRALYVYNAVEDDELSFSAGDVFTKLSEEDAQGWCRGRCNGKEGLYPANYVEQI